MIEEMLAYNREFVRSRGYEKFQTSKFPDKKIAILTCMDTRLVELLPAALGIRNGDVKLIKNAGGMITGPFDSAACWWASSSWAWRRSWSSATRTAAWPTSTPT